MPDGKVEEMTRSNARRILVIVFRTRRGDAYERGTELACRAGRWQGRGWSCAHAAAEQAGLEFLVGSKPARNKIYWGAVRNWNRARYQAAVIPPVEADPRSALSNLILQMCGLVKPLVVINAECTNHVGSCAGPADLRGKEARFDAGENEEG